MRDTTSYDNKMQQPDNDDSQQLTKQEQTALDSLLPKLEALANDVANGQSNTDLQLAELLSDAPPSTRNAIAREFSHMVEKFQADVETTQQLTPEQELLYQRMREYEEQHIAYMLSRESLRKIRSMFLANPHLLNFVLETGKELSAKGVNGLGIATTGQEQTVPAKTPAVEQEKSTGRER